MFKNYCLPFISPFLLQYLISNSSQSFKKNHTKNISKHAAVKNICKDNNEVGAKTSQKSQPFLELCTSDIHHRNTRESFNRPCKFGFMCFNWYFDVSHNSRPNFLQVQRTTSSYSQKFYISYKVQTSEHTHFEFLSFI